MNNVKFTDEEILKIMENSGFKHQQIDLFTEVALFTNSDVKQVSRVMKVFIQHILETALNKHYDQNDM